jgi:type II secretory pathway component PulF
MWHARQHAGLPYPDEPAPGAPEPFETAMVELGKESGALDDCLRLLAEYYAAEHRLVLRVARTAAYPVFTGVLATIIAPLPLAVAGGGGAYALTVGLGLAGWALGGRMVLGALVGRYLRAPRFALARLLRAIATAIAAGLPLGRAVSLGVAAAADPALAAHIAAQGPRVTSQPLATTLRGAPGVGFEVVAALQVADATGNYADTLVRLAERYESGWRPK